MLVDTLSAPPPQDSGAHPRDDPLVACAKTVRGTLSANTERAKRSDMAIYAAWCDARGERALPASAKTIAGFVDAMATNRAPATVRRYVASVAAAHRAIGMEKTAKSEPVRRALQRMHRQKGRRQGQARGLTGGLRERLLDAAGDELHQEGEKAMPTDISMRMGAVGVKGQVLDGSGRSGIELNVKSDAMWVGTKSEDTSELAPTEGDVTRLRLILQGERTFEADNGARFTPNAEVGLRHDGGDAETGTGVEIGAGLRYSVGAVTIEAQARTLVAHEDSDYQEWGASGAIRVTPSPTGRGLTLSIAPGWGQTGSAAERLWSAHDTGVLGTDSEFEPESQLEIDAGYGFGLVHGRGVFTPYAGLTLGGAGNRTVRAGTRWQLNPDTIVSVEATRQASAGEADNQLILRAALRF